MAFQEAFDNVLAEIDDWIELPKLEGDIFGHLKFKAAVGNIFEVPDKLYLRRLLYDTKIVVVVAESKKAMMDKNLMPRVTATRRAALQDGQLVTSDVVVYSYGELFTLLKSFRDPLFWNQASQNFCHPFTMFLMDVDPDFSAEFVLALNAATVFASTFNDNQQNPNTVVRLMTMSSERIHPFITKLFNHFDYCQFFELPELEDRYAPKHVASADMNKVLRKIKSWIGKEGQNQKNTIITFCGEDLMPDEWRGDPFIQDFRQIQVIHPGILDIIKASNENMLISFPETFEADFALEISGNVHIVGSVVQRRRILDRQTGHEVEVTLKLSKREREAQISAASWFNIDDTKVRFYAPANYITSPKLDFPRRMKFACEQIDGFVAAWTDLEDWPDQTFEILEILNVENGGTNQNNALSATAARDGIDYYDIGAALDQTWKRLQVQGLIGLTFTDFALGTAIPADRARFFHDLNQVTMHNGKAAHATAIQSAPNLSQLKMHLVAALWVGMKRLVEVDWQDYNGNVDLEIRSLIGFSSAAAIARYGTLWSKLGLMEAVWAKHAAGFCPNSTASHVIDGRISASTLARSKWMTYRQSISALAAREGIAMPSVDGFFHRDFKIEEDDYNQLCRHFMRAYSNQVAIVTKSRNRWEIVDFSSGEHLECTDDVLHLVNWAELIQREEGSSVLGFYTTASRASRRARTKISDWNWIPARLWEDWDRTLRSNRHKGTEAFKMQGASGRSLGSHGSHKNPDELTQGVKDTSQRLLDALFLAPSPNSTLRGALVFQSMEDGKLPLESPYQNQKIYPRPDKTITFSRQGTLNRFILPKYYEPRDPWHNYVDSYWKVYRTQLQHLPNGGDRNHRRMTIINPDTASRQTNIIHYIGDLAVVEENFFGIEILWVGNVDNETSLSDICRDINTYLKRRFRAANKISFTMGASRRPFCRAPVTTIDVAATIKSHFFGDFPDLPSGESSYVSFILSFYTPVDISDPRAHEIIQKHYILMGLYLWSNARFVRNGQQNGNDNYSNGNGLPTGNGDRIVELEDEEDDEEVPGLVTEHRDLRCTDISTNAKLAIKASTVEDSGVPLESCIRVYVQLLKSLDGRSKLNKCLSALRVTTSMRTNGTALEAAIRELRRVTESVQNAKDNGKQFREMERQLDNNIKCLRGLKAKSKKIPKRRTKFQGIKLPKPPQKPIIPARKALTRRGPSKSKSLDTDRRNKPLYETSNLRQDLRKQRRALAKERSENARKSLEIDLLRNDNITAHQNLNDSQIALKEAQERCRELEASLRSQNEATHAAQDQYAGESPITVDGSNFDEVGDLDDMIPSKPSSPDEKGNKFNEYERHIATPPPSQRRISSVTTAATPPETPVAGPSNNMILLGGYFPVVEDENFDDEMKEIFRGHLYVGRVFRRFREFLETGHENSWYCVQDIVKYGYSFGSWNDNICENGEHDGVRCSQVKVTVVGSIRRLRFKHDEDVRPSNWQDLYPERRAQCKRIREGETAVIHSARVLMIGVRTRVVVVDAVEDAAEELFEAVVVRFGSDYGGRGGYTPYAAGGRGRGFGRGRGAGAGGPNFYEGPGRAADPEFRPGDMTAMAENKAIKTIPTMITLNSGIDNGMQRMVMAIRNMMTVNSGVSKWMRRMAMVITEMNRRLPATAAPRNGYVAEEAQSASHENSEAGGKQENVAGRIGYTGKGMIWGTSVDGSDQSMVTLHRMLPLASKDIWAAVHGRKRTLSQEELSKVEVDLWPQKKGQSTQIHGWNQTVQGSGSGSISGPVNKDSKGGTQPSATQGTMNADPIQYFLGFFKGHLSDDEGR
ncbi:hypothetical protein BKA60DRAFT_606135 [Fusarium oxysporum]|nr:hypothetical protein BKA60DRAFT_606135 [Fusarium oxysporum]